MIKEPAKLLDYCFREIVAAFMMFVILGMVAFVYGLLMYCFHKLDMKGGYQILLISTLPLLSLLSRTERIRWRLETWRALMVFTFFFLMLCPYFTFPQMERNKALAAKSSIREGKVETVTDGGVFLQGDSILAVPEIKSTDCGLKTPFKFKNAQAVSASNLYIFYPDGSRAFPIEQCDGFTMHIYLKNSGQDGAFSSGDDEVDHYYVFNRTYPGVTQHYTSSGPDSVWFTEDDIEAGDISYF